MEDSNKKPDDDKSIQSCAALGVGLFCLLVGFPLWWKTTEVYRVSLPYDDVTELASSSLTYSVNVHVIKLSDVRISSHFGEKLKSELETGGHQEFDLNVKYSVHVQDVPDEKTKKAFDNAKDCKDFEAGLDHPKVSQQNNSYFIYLLPETSKLLTVSASIGVGRSAFVKTSQDEDSTLLVVGYIIQEVFVNKGAMMKAYLSARETIRMEADKESMRGLRSHPAYEITFSVLNPQPDMVRVSWDIEGGIDKYLKPLLTAFGDYSTLNVKSQFLHQSNLGVSAHRDSVNSQFYLSHNQLPHIINPVEAYLGSHISNNPNLNFVVYVPTRDQSPLYIRDSAGSQLPSNAFLSPRWGGLLIYNVDPLPPNATLPVPVEIDMRKLMAVFVPQLRMLLGIRPKVSRSDIDFLSPGRKLLSDWELDVWLREQCIQNIVSSSATLDSLMLLLDRIKNIVINDDIGKEVESAVKFIRKSKDYLLMGKLNDAFLFAKKGMIATEAAFFDPSLLQLLYFPQDQKFAIYIPLFLPVGLPIVLSTVQAIKWLLNYRRKLKKD